ncbi:MAG TPA: hypothetical protein VMJ72_01245 [Candidatus Paceibacterota bacterium]|nr:hypothetical protein [Candidatus Paceibacterota bacterium]
MVDITEQSRRAAIERAALSNEGKYPVAEWRLDDVAYDVGGTFPKDVILRVKKVDIDAKTVLVDGGTSLGSQWVPAEALRDAHEVAWDAAMKRLRSNAAAQESLRKQEERPN